MAKNTIAYYTKDGKFKTTDVTNGAFATLFTAGADGSRVLMITTNEASADSLILQVYDGSTAHNLLTHNPVVANGDVLDATNLPKGANNMRYINLPAGYTLLGRMSAGSNVEVAVYGEDY